MWAGGRAGGRRRGRLGVRSRATERALRAGCGEVEVWAACGPIEVRRGGVADWPVGGGRQHARPVGGGEGGGAWVSRSRKGRRCMG